MQNWKSWGTAVAELFGVTLDCLFGMLDIDRNISYVQLGTKRASIDSAEISIVVRTAGGHPLT